MPDPDDLDAARDFYVWALSGYVSGTRAEFEAKELVKEGGGGWPVMMLQFIDQAKERYLAARASAGLDPPSANSASGTDNGSSVTDEMQAEFEASIATHNRASAALLESIMQREADFLDDCAEKLLGGHSVLVNRPEGVIGAHVMGSGEQTVIRVDTKSIGGSGGWTDVPFSVVPAAERRAALVRVVAVQLLNLLESSTPEKPRPA